MKRTARTLSTCQRQLTPFGWCVSAFVLLAAYMALSFSLWAGVELIVAFINKIFGA